MEPKLSLNEAKVIVAQKTAPKVTEESIKAKISTVNYETYVMGETVGTLCIIEMKNGWISTGFAAPVSAANFDAEVGKRYAYNKAFEPLWQLEGYLLRDRLSNNQ